MRGATTILLFVGNFSLSLIVIYLYFWLIVSLGYTKRRETEAPGFAKFAVVVPAHNEELVIETLLRSVNALDYPQERFETIVIADNCTDRTEEIVTRAGFSCLVRIDPSRRGKPYALQWAFQQLDIEQYDAFVIVDADTAIDSQFLKNMNRALHEGAEIIQGYFGILNPDETWLTRLMVIPGVLKFRYRYRGKVRLGFSCPLMGNGMCFARRVIAEYGWDALTLTENWEYYIKSLLRGIFPTYEEAYIFSQTASTTQQGKTQRLRWLKGRIQCVRAFLPLLLKAFAFRRDPRILDCTAELLLPSISMLCNAGIFLFLMSLLAAILMPGMTVFLVWAAVLLLGLGGYFIFGLAASHAPRDTWLALAKVPVFLVWKFFTTIVGFITIRQREWIKTRRG